MVARMDLVSIMAPLVQLAKERNKVVTVFDLEATTFLGRPNFGITEVGMLHINPKGQIATAGSFVNPQHRISPDAKALTGITDAMVKDSPTWGVGWGEAWSLIAKEHLVIGYNSGSFDGPAIVSEHKRYNQPALILVDHLDAFKMHKKAHNTKSGKLADVAALLGIDTKNFEGHRATNDAIMTALVMSALWERFPTFRDTAIALPKVIIGSPPSHIRPAVANPVGSYRRGVATPPPVLQRIRATSIATTKTTPRSASAARPDYNITDFVIPYFANKSTFGQSDITALAMQMDSEHSAPEKLHQGISFEISRCLDKHLIGPLEPDSARKKDFLKNTALTSELKRMWSTTPRLAPIFEYVKKQVPEVSDLNYIDVRWMLDFHGVRPATPVSISPGM